MEEDLVMADVRWPDRLYRCITQALMYASPLLEVVPQHVSNGRGLYRAMDRLLPFFTLYNTLYIHCIIYILYWYTSDIPVYTA